MSLGSRGATAGLALGLMLLSVLPGCGLFSGRARQGTTMTKEATMHTTAFEHGFRHDPMRFVESDRSLQGAMVRSLVFEAPKPGDRELIQAEIEKVLGKQLPDGRLSDDPNHSYQFTSEALIRVAEMGCPAEQPEVQKALAAILGKPKPNQADPHGIYDVRAFCLLGLADEPKFRDLARAGLNKVMEREAEWSDISEGCPWTPVEHLITLWHGRGVAETGACVVKALKWIGEGINDAGCLSYKDPWGFVRLASVVDHPLAKRILEKEIPVILRGQQADGGWGDRSLLVLRALHRHGLLEPLRRKPPLPPDWRIVKSIPAPEADCFGLAWDGERLWTRCGKANEAVAISPADGKVVRRLRLPAEGAFGLGAWGDALAVTDKKAKKLLRVDAETGKVEREIDLGKMEWINGVTEVGGKLAVADGFMGCVMLYDPTDPTKPEPRVLGGPIPVDLATDGDAVWHLDVWAPALIKSGLDRHGHLLDWGEKPFDGRCDGVAHDGHQLWALDAKGKRICAIEKAAPPPHKLLDKSVAAFDHMQKHVASHSDWGQGMYPYPQPCVYLQMHWVEMQARGWDVDFDTLAAVSGASAMFAYQPKEFMPKYANLHIDMDRRIAEATGFGYEWAPFKDAENAWQIIKETVDSGRVAKGWDWENCAFCGYQEADEPEGRSLFAIGDGPGTFSTWWTWKQFTGWCDRIAKWKQNRLGRHASRVPTKPPTEVALRVMQDLVAWSTDPPEVCRKHFPRAIFGLAGVERYAADCADIGTSPDWVMCHDINPQWTVRHSTAIYLGRVAEGRLFGAKATESIAKAAAEYKAAAERWHKAYGLLGHGTTKEQRREKARREAGARHIREALAHEKAGIAALRLALAAEGGQAMPGNAPGAALEREGGKVWIGGLEPYRVMDPMFEGVRLILALRGDRYSPDYIQGISGSAFRIGGICPCAPTCENAMQPQDLLRLLGYESEHVKIEGKDEALKDSTRKAVARVKQEIDACRTALVWHAFTNAEWDVVYGYDAEKKQFLGRGSYAGNDKPFAAADEMRTGQCGEICDPCGVILIGPKTGHLDAPKAELAALKEAVRHARDQKNVEKLGGEKWVMLAGLACYDRWIRDFGRPDKKLGMGDAYCYGVYHSTHAAAAGFLREIAPRHPAMAERLKRAADHFQAEAETLAKGKKLLWWDAPEGPDPKRNAQAAALLKQARDAYAAGIAQLEAALAEAGKD